MRGGLHDSLYASPTPPPLCTATLLDFWEAGKGKWYRFTGS